MSAYRRSIALTIAGFDPTGGAGVLADVRTFAAFGFQAAAAITSVTFQNTARVFGALHQTGEAVRAQVIPLLEDARIVCAKLGMLPTRDVVLEVARLFRENDLPRPVVDPVIMSSSGYRLMAEGALAALIEHMLPLARLITPNIPEAETLTGITITSEIEMHRAAAIMRELGARAVLIKGGHLKERKAVGSRQEAVGSEQKAVGSEQKAEGRKQKAEGSRQEAVGSEQRAVSSEQKAEGRRQKAEGSQRETVTDKAPESDEAIDVLDNEGKITVFRERRVSGAKLHGSGCILSAAIAAGLGKGMTLEDSVGAAKSFVLDAIRNSSGVEAEAK